MTLLKVNGLFIYLSMDLFVNHKGNKENNNPVLVPSQFEILSKEGVFNKTNTLLYPQNRFHYRKPRYSIT